LQCLLAWRDPALVTHRDALMDLLDESKMRNTLVRERE
jgi:hypothetical protein